MSRRASGYTYCIGADGKRHRVYNNTRGRASRGEQRIASLSKLIPIEGEGAYYNGRAVSRAYAQRTLMGSGGYYDGKFVKTMRKIVPKGGLSAAGAAIGSKYGLGSVGGALGGLASKILGFGSYTVKRNSMIDEGQSPANMHSNNSKMVVRHREYITDIISGASNTYKNQSFPIQVGLTSSYPWLAPIAQQYEQYKILGMVYEFKTLSADAIASSQANMSIGGVIMATDYNSINPPFVSKQQMENNQYTTSAKASMSFYHAVECDPNDNPLPMLYVRAGAAPQGSDLRMYDLGNFQVASFGIAAANVVLGELWCSYEIELSKPVSTNAIGQDVLTDHYVLTGVNSSQPLGGGAATLVEGSSIGGTKTSSTVYTFPPTFQEGTYQVTYACTGGTSAVIAAPPLGVVNCTIVPSQFTNNTADRFQSTNGVSSLVYFLTFIVRITGLNASFSVGSGGTLPGTISSADLWITQVDSNLVLALP